MFFENKFGNVVKGGNFDTMSTESVKIPSSILKKVRKHVKGSKQTIGGFISIAIENELKKAKGDNDIVVPDWVKEHNNQFK